MRCSQMDDNETIITPSVILGQLHDLWWPKPDYSILIPKGEDNKNV